MIYCKILSYNILQYKCRGVLCALPAFVENGLYRHLDGSPHLPEGEFAEAEAVGINGALETIRRAERGVHLGETGGGIWMKEIRQQTKCGQLLNLG